MAETTTSKADRIAGSIYGVLVCDALGGPCQFQKPGKFKPITSYREITHFGKPAGAWSDDGSMTLCIVQQLIDSDGKFSAAEIAYNFWRWYFEDYLSSDGPAWDVGNATGVACDMWDKIFDGATDGASMDAKHIDAVQKRIYESTSLNVFDAQGNGSLMRVAPIGLAFPHDLDAAMRFARQQSDLSHPQPACGDACAIYTRLIVEALAQDSGDLRIRKTASARTVANMDISDRLLRDRLRSRCPPGATDPLQWWSKHSKQDVQSSGWVVHTLDCALWAFFTTDSFAEGALAVVNLGGDSDTAGAVYGGLAGAFYGVDAIPLEWKEGLLERRMVNKMIEQFVQVVATKE